MPTTNVGSKWVSGDLIFFNKTTGNAIITIKSDGTISVETANKLDIAGVIVPASFVVIEALQGASAATAANYGVFFIAPFACEVISVRENHTTAGTDAGAVTLDVEKLTGTQASGAGVAVLGATKINLKGVAETVQAPALTATTANKQLAVGDKLNLLDAGVLTAVAGTTVTVELKRI